MKIIHCVESYFPSVGGMQEVVRQLSERLVGMGHEVIVATRYLPGREGNNQNGVQIRGFKISGNLVEGMQGEVAEYRRFLLEEQYDVITFFAAQQWATDAALDLLPQIRAKKVNVPTGYSGFYWPEYQGYFEQMKTWIKEYDMNVYLSDDYRDINFARAQGVSKLRLIPNGAAADEFLPKQNISVRHELGLAEDTFLLLHVGSYTGVKGHLEAVEIFLRSDLKHACLLMIGNNYEGFRRTLWRRPKLAWLWYTRQWFSSRKIHFGFFKRKFTVAAYQQADLFLFPSNIECSPVVLFEAAAAGIPFASTDVGNAREIAGWTGGGLILPTHIDADGFSHADIAGSVNRLNELYHQPQQRAEMGARAHAAWLQYYSWEVIASAYESLYLELTTADTR